LGPLAAFPVRLYQLTLGKLLPSRCRFFPSCSSYAVEAFRTNGLVKGGLQTLWRLVRCGPWSAGGFDPVGHVGPAPVRATAQILRRAHHSHG
ncbi:MAG: membrane protein insertion efficiency factor YidD, partial [Actinomycetota bacterium]